MSAAPYGIREPTTGLALALTVDRVAHELIQQLRRALSCEAIAVAVADPAAPDGLRLAHHVGFDSDASAIEQSFRPVWRDVLTEGSTQTRRTAAGHEISAPIGTEGALTVVVVAGSGDSSRLQEGVRIVSMCGAHAATALERAAAIERRVDKERTHAMQEVAAGIGHELRSPTFAISSAAQLLRYTLPEDPVVEKNIGRILREVDRLNRLVEALASYGSPPPIKTVIGDPDDVWAQVLEAHQGELESKAILVYHRQAEPRAACSVDTEQLAHAFGSMLSNAVDGAEEGTDLSVEATVVPGAGWVCRLRDNRPIVPPEVLSRAFDPFFTTTGGRNGIRLALARRVIVDHGGSVELEVNEHGTMLTVTLPVSIEPDR